jgi:hypothetical protein
MARIPPGAAFVERPIMSAVLTGIVWGVFHYPLILLGFEGNENIGLGHMVFPVSRWSCQSFSGGCASVRVASGQAAWLTPRQA